MTTVARSPHVYVTEDLSVSRHPIWGVSVTICTSQWDAETAILDGRQIRDLIHRLEQSLEGSTGPADGWSA